MPRYYFRFANGTHQCSDCDPLDLPDDESARREAELDAYDLLDSDEWCLGPLDHLGHRRNGSACDFGFSQRRTEEN